jgi:hypothetical protein
MNYLDWEQGKADKGQEAWFSRQLMPFGLPAIVLTINHASNEENTVFAVLLFGSEAINFPKDDVKNIKMLAEHAVLDRIQAARKVMLGH